MNALEKAKAESYAYWNMAGGLWESGSQQRLWKKEAEAFRDAIKESAINDDRDALADLIDVKFSWEEP